jgi:hypothetical protein
MSIGQALCFRAGRQDVQQVKFFLQFIILKLIVLYSINSLGVGRHSKMQHMGEIYDRRSCQKGVSGFEM